jgi:hypothetical protein
MLAGSAGMIIVVMAGLAAGDRGSGFGNSCRVVF